MNTRSNKFLALVYDPHLPLPTPSPRGNSAHRSTNETVTMPTCAL